MRKQMPKVKMVCGDTMNYWIADHRANLAKVLRDLDVLLINDGEARMLAGEHNLVRAAKKILAMGPKTLIVKHGEYGATAFFSERSFPARSRRRVRRLPRAGAAAGGGGRSDGRGRFVCRRILRLPRVADGELTPADFRKAMFYGGVMGSFAVEGSAPSACRR